LGYNNIMKLKVERLSQNSLFNKYLWLGNSKLTIGNYGCYLTSLCMLMRYKGFFYTISQLNTALRKNGGFIGAEINPSGVLNVLGRMWKFERKDWENVPANISIIQELIDSDYPVIAKVDYNPNTKAVEGHFVLITGYVLTNGKITDLWINDAWDGKEYQLCQKYPYLKIKDPKNSVLGLRIYRQK